MAATVWRGHLTFGLVSIPVRLYPAARAKKVRLNHVFRPKHEPAQEPEPVGAQESEEPSKPAARATEAATIVSGTAVRVHYGPATESSGPDQREVVKAFEFEKDRYVTIGKPELDRLAVRTSTAMEISEFVKLSEIDPVFFETSYFVAADPGGEKPYALLFEAMRTSGYAAVASLAMHRREHVVVLRPGDRGLLLHTLFYADEVRREQEFAADPALVAPKELQVAGLLVEALAGSFDPSKYRDSYRENLNALIAERLDKAPSDQPGKAVIDIMSALRESLAKLKKPPLTEKAPKRARRAG